MLEFGIKFGELEQTQSAETMKKIMRPEKKLNEEARRRRVYEKYLLKYQRDSSVLRDFHTNRF